MQKAITEKTKAAAFGAVLAAATLWAGCAANRDTNWRSKLAAELPVLGHRNWIIVADSAYPAQSRPGIETIATGSDQIQVVKAVLKAVDDAAHVRANVYLDAEMQFVSPQDAPGIEHYRSQLSALLAGRAPESLPHEDLIAKLDDAAKMFRVLILKTDLTMPYTSVFLELDCGYWNPDAERKMREAIRQAVRP